MNYKMVITRFLQKKFNQKWIWIQIPEDTSVNEEMLRLM